MVKPMYPNNYWSVRVAAEKRQERKNARLHVLEEAGWVAFLALYVGAAAVIFGFKELPYGEPAVPVWVGEVVFFAVAAFAVWRYDREQKSAQEEGLSRNRRGRDTVPRRISGTEL